MIVLDTNVVSEILKNDPAPAVLAWLGRQTPRDLYLTAITAAELRHGVARLPAGRRRSALQRDVDQLLHLEFGSRILSFDATAAECYADVMVSRQRAGRPIGHTDGTLAAICFATEARLATRNTKDFEGTGIRLLNPWRAR